MDTIIVKMDIRGFLRFPEQAIKTLKLDKMAKQDSSKKGTVAEIGPYADIEVDPVGKRVAITPIKEAKSTSFRFIVGINSVKSKFLYFKGVVITKFYFFHHNRPLPPPSPAGREPRKLITFRLNLLVTN